MLSLNSKIGSIACQSVFGALFNASQFAAGLDGSFALPIKFLAVSARSPLKICNAEPALRATCNNQRAFSVIAGLMLNLCSHR